MWVTESPHLQKESSFLYMRRYEEIKQLGVRVGWSGVGRDSQLRRRRHQDSYGRLKVGWVDKATTEAGCRKVTVNKVSILQLGCMKSLLLNF